MVDNQDSENYKLLGEISYGLGLGEEALRALKKARELGDAEVNQRIEELEGAGSNASDFNFEKKLDRLLEDSVWTNESIEDRQERLIREADEGNLDSANELGTMLASDGLFEEAIAFHRKAAMSGDPHAQNNLGADYRWLGQYDEAIHWYTLAAEAGYDVAQNNLAALYVERSQPHLAMPWFKKAADQGNIHASLNMAKIIAEEGLFGDALNILKPLADGGTTEACNPVGVLYAQQGDIESAKSYWANGAKYGDADCLLNLGVYYLRNGKSDLALEWLALAQRRNHPIASEIIASIEGSPDYETADGLSQYEAALSASRDGREDDALLLVAEAAKLGWHEAQYDLGVMTLEAWSMTEEADPNLRDKAMEWFLKAARQGNNDARDALMEHLSPEGFKKLNL